jgi:threonine dehydrogenase-like Zn-dependent dehydrogenase
VPAPTLYPIHGNRFSLENIAPALLTLMQNGGLEPKRLITHRLPCERLVEAYDMALRRDKSMLGVLFEWH